MWPAPLGAAICTLTRCISPRAQVGSKIRFRPGMFGRIFAIFRTAFALRAYFAPDAGAVNFRAATAARRRCHLRATRGVAGKARPRPTVPRSAWLGARPRGELAGGQNAGNVSARCWRRTLRLFRYHGCLLPIRCWPLAWCSEWCCVACRRPLRGSPCRVATGGAASGVCKSVLLTSSEGSTGGGPATQTRLMQYRLPRSSGRLCPR